MCRVSVIVPVYQVEAYLPGCLDSILAQTFEDFELILWMTARRTTARESWRNTPQRTRASVRCTRRTAAFPRRETRG